jgi:hypothetical protein
MSAIGNAKWLWEHERKGILWGIIVGMIISYAIVKYYEKRDYIKKPE